MEKTKKKARQAIFIPQNADISLHEWKSLMKVFAETRPEIEASESSREKSWEYLLCAFFALLSAGVLGTNSPITSFYSLLLSSFNPDKGFCRINDKKRDDGKNIFKGRKIYPPALAMIHLLSYCLHLSKKMPNEWGRDDRLVPRSHFPQLEFQKRFRAWIARVCTQAGVQKTPSIRTIANFARLDLIENYPSFIIGLFSGKVQWSPMPDMLAGERAAFFGFGEPRNSPPNTITPLSCGEPSVIDDTLSLRIDLNYSKLYDYLSALSLRSTKEERTDTADMVNTLWREEHPLFMNQPAGFLDGINFLLAADWLRAMLLYPKLTVNTIRTYFGQVSAVLRAELYGEDLNGLNQGDMEAILENCIAGNSARILKAAMKSFLRYISKVHKIELGPISWRTLSVESSMKDVQILWPSDVEKILAATDDPQIRQAIQLGFCCGMRISEITYLSPRDVYLKAESFLDIKITKSKAGKRRLPLYLLMTSNELEELSSFYDASQKSGGGQEVLFITAEGLPFHNPQVLSMAVERVMARAGYAWATFHILRHSFASILLLRWFRALICSDLMDDLQKELQIYDIDKDRDLIENGLHSIGVLLGHADVRTTVTNYIHTADLLQKAYRDLYERDNELCLSYGQAVNLTGYSLSGLYKRFRPDKIGKTLIEATELIELQVKHLARPRNVGSPNKKNGVNVPPERQLTEIEHMDNYHQYERQGELLNIKYSKRSAIKYVVVDAILPAEHSRPDWNEKHPNFWYHHANTPEIYNAMAEKYLLIRERLIKGEKLRSLENDRELRRAIGFWWGKKNSVLLIKFRGTYFVFSGFHRVALAKKHGIREIPASVIEAKLKKDSNAYPGAFRPPVPGSTTNAR